MKYKNIFLVFTLCTSISTLSKTCPEGAHPACINEWSFIDDKGVVFPWFTKPFLNILSSWDTKNWDVFEWGSGYSTGWFSMNCKSIISVDDNANWGNSVIDYIKRLGKDNCTMKIRDCGKRGSLGGEPHDRNPYVNAITEQDKKYDCIIIDGMCRNTCAELALEYIKPGGIIILDNADQGSIGLNSKYTFKLFKDLEHYSYLQPGHNDWRTDYWIAK